MKFRLTVFFLIIADICCGAMTLSLRESIVVPYGSDIFLSDIVIEDICRDENVVIRHSITSKSRIRTSDILTALGENGIYDISLFGSGVMVYTDSGAAMAKHGDGTYIPSASQNNSPDGYNILSDREVSDVSAAGVLERYLSQYIDGRYVLSVSVDRVVPPADLHTLTDYKWELPRIKSGISDIVSLKKLAMTSAGRRYSVYIDVSIKGTVYMAARLHRSGETLSSVGWTRKNVDISVYRDCEHIVSSVPSGQWRLTEDVKPGQILKWTSISAIPLVYKGEPLTAVSQNDRITLSLPCIAVSDGYQGEPLRIALVSGNEMTGILQPDKTVKF